jgi:cell division protease FtsH
MIKKLLVWTVIGFFFISFLGNMNKGQIGQEVSYAKFIDLVNDGQVMKVVVDKRGTVIGEYRDGGQFITYSPNDPHMVDDLLENNVDIIANPPEESSLLGSIFISWFPILLLIGVWIWYMKRMGGGAQNKMGKNKAKKLEQSKIKVTFADVAGVEEALEEVSEMVDFLRNPPKYVKLGAKIPKGALMVGICLLRQENHHLVLYSLTKSMQLVDKEVQATAEVMMKENKH